MGEHETWFHLLPGLRSFEQLLSHKLGDGLLMGTPTHSLAHVWMTLFILLVLVVLGVLYRRKMAALGDRALVPSSRFSVRALVEGIAGYFLDMMSGVMGRKAARHFLPLIAGLGFFILFSNLAGLIPGFLPPTDVLETTVAAGLIVFFATHIYGLKAHGWAYIKHLMGPVWWLAPLLFVIEIISHLARPMSLALRLMGNMVGDHVVLTIFLGLVPILVPIPVMLLGVIVCLVQTMVFCLLSTVYIAMAIEDEEESEEESPAEDRAATH